MKEKDMGKLPRRYRQLASRLAGTGLILPGTITARTIAPGKGKNRPGDKTYGPYYQWTFKQQGKTVTINLTAAQAKLFGKAIAHNRQLETILKEMRKLSREICETQTEGVKKRKSRKSLEKGLN